MLPQLRVAEQFWHNGRMERAALNISAIEVQPPHDKQITDPTVDSKTGAAQKILLFFTNPLGHTPEQGIENKEGDQTRTLQKRLQNVYESYNK